jgi:DNA invertase Pin-like site-specific DNA recombinase
MNLYGLYTRETQREDAPSADTESQLRDLKADLSTSGVEGIDWKISCIYRERSSAERPEFDRALRDLAAGVIDVLMCTDVELVCPSRGAALRLRQVLERHGGRFVAISCDVTSDENATAVAEAVCVLFNMTPKKAWDLYEGARSSSSEVTTESPGLATHHGIRIDAKWVGEQPTEGPN